MELSAQINQRVQQKSTQAVGDWKRNNIKTRGTTVGNFDIGLSLTVEVKHRDYPKDKSRTEIEFESKRQETVIEIELKRIIKEYFDDISKKED